MGTSLESQKSYEFIHQSSSITGRIKIPVEKIATLIIQMNYTIIKAGCEI